MNTQHESFLSRDGSPREFNLLASVETVSTQQCPSRVVLTYAILNIAHKFSVLKMIKAQLKAEIPHTDRKDQHGSKIYIKQPRCLSRNKGYYVTKALLQTN